MHPHENPQSRDIQKAARIAAMQKARPDTPIC